MSTVVFNVGFKVGPWSSLPQWEGEAESPEDARDKGLVWAETESALGIKAKSVTEVIVVWEDNGKPEFKVFDLSSSESPQKKEQKDPKWPFKHLKRKSSWPMQGIVIQFAAAVTQAPPPAREEAADKMVERCFRMGARLALEFGMSPVKALQIAQKQIEREIPGANQVIAEHKVQEANKVSEMADAIVSGQLSELLGKKDPKAKKGGK